MIAEDLVKWAEWNCPDLYEMYIYDEEKNTQVEILKEILKKRLKKEPLYFVGFHPEVLKKIGISIKEDLSSEIIKRLINRVGGKYFYSFYLKEEL